MSVSRSPLAVLALGASGLALGCSVLSSLRPNEARCYPPAPDFSEADLVGTWIAGVPDNSDALVIRPDGTYKQEIHVKFAEGAPTEYQSEWQPWRLEYSEDGIAYLHLESYSFCGMNSSISCQQRDGDGYDICQDESVSMENEGILLVLGTNLPDMSPEAEVFYYLHYPMGSEGSWVYIRQEP